MPTEHGRPIALTKHIAAYVEEVPRVWEVYLKEKSKGMEQGKAERNAMRSVYPGDTNIGVRLQTWKTHKFWPEEAFQEIEEAREALRALLYRGTPEDNAESEAVSTVLKDYPHATEALEIWKRCGVWSTQSTHSTKEDLGTPRISKVTPGDSRARSKTRGDSNSKAGPGKSKDVPGETREYPGLSRDEILEGMRALLSEIDVEERKWYGKATGKAPEGEKLDQIGGKVPPDLVLQVKRLPGRIGHHLERALKLYLMVLASDKK